MAEHGSDEHTHIRCSECGFPLAHDQRYCVACGARSRPLPRHVSGVLAGIMERGTRAPVASELVAGEAADGPDPRRSDAWLIAPRAAAVTVIGMLGFGVVVGSLVGAGSANPLSQLIVELSPHSPRATAPPLGATAGGADSGGGGGGGGTITITTTTPAPPTPAAAAPAGSAGAANASGTTTPTNLPPIKHVFMVVLSGEGYNETFGHSADDPYLATKLARQGELVLNYYAVAGSPLANEIALVSGQGPNPDTAADCPTYDSLVASGLGASGQLLGTGCVFPSSAPSLADELTSAKLTWKTYLQTKGSQKIARPEACRPRLGGPTVSQTYATWRNPFLFFSSLTPTKCPKPNAPLGQLARDLKKSSTTPSFSYIVADTCDDGSAVPCTGHAAAGMGPADAFLKSVIPEIKRSPAYKADGLIAITFDNAPQVGPNADSSSCCGNPVYPNMLGATTTPTTTTGTTTTGTTTTGTTTGTTTTGTDTTTTDTTTTDTTTSTTPTGTTTTGTTTTGTTTTGTTTTGTTTTGTTAPSALSGGETNPTGGGGQVGLLLLSKYVKPNQPEVTDYYNHFSLLASIEKLFGLERLGYAADSGLPLFGPGVWDNYTPG